jgi:hypothetical protein
VPALTITSESSCRGSKGSQTAGALSNFLERFRFFAEDEIDPDKVRCVRAIILPFRAALPIARGGSV